MAKEISVAMSKTDLFMENFDPVNSNREKRKKLRTQPGEDGNGNGGSKRGKEKKGGILYNEKGLLIHDLSDLCDCLQEKCPGCFFPCLKCRSPKCGTDCRVHRRTILESIDVEGTNIVFKNEHLPPNK